MDPKEVKRLIKLGESESLEFKSAFSNEVIETLAAFSNTRGGVVLAGVADSGVVCGVSVKLETIQQWLNEIKTKTLPALTPEVELVPVAGKNVVVFRAPEYPVKPVSFKGRFFKRVKNSNHLMRPEEVAQAHYKSFNSSWDYTDDPEHTLADISLAKVRKFISRANQGREVEIKDSPLEVLKKFKLLRGKILSRACYLLFLKDESLFTAVELGHFQTETLIKDGARTKADLFTQVDAAMSFITKHINKEYIITGAPQRQERWDYPLDALREIVVNSIVHRDYSGSTSGIIKVFNDKIQIYNSGKLPPGLTVPMLLRGEYSSTPRNVQVAEMFKEAGVIERYGSGIRRIVEDFNAYGLVAPEFKEVGESFLVTVYKKRLEAHALKRTAKSSEESSEKMSEKSSERVLSLIHEKSAISAVELASIIGITSRAIEKILAKLKKEGSIKRIGPAKGGYWEIL